jgi:hypothetical protein
MAAGQGFKTFATGDVLSAADVNGYLMQGVLVFADSAERDAEITSPEEGQFAYLKDTNVTTYYTGSVWANLDTTGMTNPMTTTGDVIYSSSGSTPARLGIGTAGQVLQVNSGATAPEWATPAGGGSTYAGASAYRSSSQTLTANAYTAIEWNAEYWDTDAYHDNSTNPSRFTIPSGKAGYYSFRFNVGIGSISGDVYFHVRVNGTTKWNFSWDMNSPTSVMSSATLNLAESDYVELFIYNTSAITTAANEEALCSFDYLGA